MDFKQLNTDPTSASPFEDFGNFAFGAYTYSAGITQLDALAGAGFAQWRSGNTRLRDMFSFFDTPEDQEQIKSGGGMRAVSRVSIILAGLSLAACAGEFQTYQTLRSTAGVYATIAIPPTKDSYTLCLSRMRYRPVPDRAR